jgi:hypothetical protein
MSVIGIYRELGRLSGKCRSVLHTMRPTGRRVWKAAFLEQIYSSMRFRMLKGGAGADHDNCHFVERQVKTYRDRSSIATGPIGLQTRRPQ